MKYIYLVLTGLLIFNFIGCVPSQQAIVIDPVINSYPSRLPETKVLLPGHSLPRDLFILKILNGLNYRVLLEVTNKEEPLNFTPGSSISIPFKKDRRPRLIFFTGQVFEMGSGELMGTITNGLMVPKRRNDQAQEGVWHITSFKKFGK